MFTFLIIVGCLVCLGIIAFLFYLIRPPSGPQYDSESCCWRCGACGSRLPESSIPEHYQGRKPSNAQPQEADTIANLGN